MAAIPPPLRPDGQVKDLQGDFQSLKDSVAKIKLLAELKNNESREGIRRSERCRYSETSVKLLSTIEAGSKVSQDTLDQLFLIQNFKILNKILLSERN